MFPRLQDRVALVFEVLGESVLTVSPLAVNFNSLKLKITLTDGSTLRLNEYYQGDELKKYAYYWLNGQNNLIVGWDNAPHHTYLPTHPHHKHIANQSNIQPSSETGLEAVLEFIKAKME